MSIDQTVLRLRTEGKERFAVRHNPVREEWKVLSGHDKSNISEYFERQKANLKTIGQAYEVIMNYAKLVLNSSECEVEIVQTGKLQASDPEYRL